MKRAKIMLISITVLAIVGGALAFKTKKFITSYCYTTTNHLDANHTSCPFSLQSSKSTILGASEFLYYYTITANPANCSVAVGGPFAPCLTTTIPSTNFTKD